MNRCEAAAIARAAKQAKALSLHDRFWMKVDKKSKDECWPWIAATRKKGEGYGAFWYKGRHHPSSRIAYFLSTGVFETDLHICHSCDNPSCCNPSHLFAGTNLDNNNDKVSKKRHAFGERNGISKINDSAVVEIREARKSKTLKEVGEIFGLKLSTISRICRRESWSHVK